ncbi:hypothetical protein [Methylotuvimicrobium buryatense]|uniref:Uncharacterized protein n=1 Tax=Methylotuvimicrobium buryatense TaxID=95641 RepID=A0A4P9ULJ3_METBY|nr:hypothetical protein [Methylotuvimicrobium buryatense]QCW81011.1 hypothetical protein EQU24_01135 [Methylotuvimicrobium buryatense]
MEEFTIIGFLDAGVKYIEKSGKFCLVCLTEDYERLVIWSDEYNTANLSAVSGKPLPFVILCEVMEPEGPSAAAYGDVYWVDEDSDLIVIDRMI